MRHMSIGLLGPIRLVIDGASIALPRRQVRGVLAVLSLHVGQPVSAETMMEWLWPDDLPGDPIHAVHVYVSRLRHLDAALGRAIHTAPAGYVLDVDPSTVDAILFERRVADAHDRWDRDPAGALDTLDAALGMWRGAALGCFSGSQPGSAAARRLERLRVDAEEDRFGLMAACGLRRTMIPALEEFTIQHPYRERAVALLVESLLAEARMVEAVRIYRRHCALLERELGIEPSPQLQSVAAAFVG